jgi:hypothetical protein
VCHAKALSAKRGTETTRGTATDSRFPMSLSELPCQRTASDWHRDDRVSHNRDCQYRAARYPHGDHDRHWHGHRDRAGAASARRSESSGVPHDHRLVRGTQQCSSVHIEHGTGILFRTKQETWKRQSGRLPIFELRAQADSDVRLLPVSSSLRSCART